ncbi:MAG TPA: hypothetical protein VG889_17300 [Rhizomicrobium sp.]|nr:hypothetical protein [Rhizomicrobium sp.]
MTDNTACDQLAVVFAEGNAERKLVDVKFYVGNPSGVAPELLCEEQMRVHAAMKDGVKLRLPKI